METVGGVQRWGVQWRYAVTAALAVLAVSCASTNMKTLSDSSTLAPGGAFDCAAGVVTSLGYVITDSLPAEGMLKAETKKPTVIRHDGSVLVYRVIVTISRAEDSRDSMMEVTSNNESHARTILRACLKKEEATEEEKQ